MTIKVKLRKKKISGNRHSLYLDFYPAIKNPLTGKLTRREFLGHYLIDKPKNQTDKQHNIDTLLTAEQIRQKKDNELSKPEIYSGYELEELRFKEKSEKSFIAYFKKIADERNDTWITAYKYFEKFCSKNLTFADLDEKIFKDFAKYLLSSNKLRSKHSKLSQNSAAAYFGRVKSTLKLAYREGFLRFDLNTKINYIEEVESQRNFCTIEELNLLAKTDCNFPVLKAASLFSALTGLRFSDIEKMVWGEIEYTKGQGYSIRFEQQKTKGKETMPISEQAFSLLGVRKGPLDKVFEDLNTFDRYQHFPIWVAKAGITKHLTFHSLRHTYATLQLSNGTDIYTVSKMLGHKELKTTQIYAKIIDKTKRDTTDKIKLNLINDN